MAALSSCLVAENISAAAAERPIRLFGDADGYDKKQKAVRLPLFCRFGQRHTGDGYA